MKRITTLAIICLSFCQLIAQNLPQGIAYQAVAVKDGPYSIAGQNPQAIYWSNKDINVRFTIYEKYPGGANQYSETHATKTDDYGVFNLIIGQGNVISGDFTKIPWDLGTAHLQVEIDFDNSGTYKLTSLERFWSVPYAFVTRKSSSTSTDSALNALNNKFNYLRNRDKDTVIGNEGGVSYKSLDSLNKVLVAKLAAIQTSDKDTVVGNEWQKLNRVGDTLTLSDGGGKVTLLDEDPKNELQRLSISNDTLTLSNGGGSIQLSDVVNQYGYKPSVTASIRSASTNSLCFNGVMVDLENWGATNGWTSIYPNGAIADSLFVFTVVGGTNWAVFLHDIKSKKMTRIYNKSVYQVYAADSMVYIMSDQSGYDISVFHLTPLRTLDSISTFTSNLGVQFLETPVITGSGDLVWIKSSSGAQGDIVKYSWSLKKMITYTNPQSGKLFGISRYVGGDTMILGTRLINTKNMNQLNDFSFIQKAGRNVWLHNGRIYYIGSYTPVSSGNVLRVMDLNSQTDIPLGATLNFQFLGINNDELWFTATVDGGTNQFAKLCNLGLSSKIPTICSILPNGMFVSHGFGDGSTIQAMYTDNHGFINGAFYPNSIQQYFHCVNSSLPLFKLGYFYSK